jgi:hypothetical protein
MCCSCSLEVPGQICSKSAAYFVCDNSCFAQNIQFKKQVTLDLLPTVIPLQVLTAAATTTTTTIITNITNYYYYYYYHHRHC